MTYIFVDFKEVQKWIEVDENGYALRQITNEDENFFKRLHNSCRDGYLTEGVVDTVNGCRQISKEDFENIWHDATHELRSTWDACKKDYPIGERVSGVVKYLYPQGSIFDLGDIQGCAIIDGFKGDKRFLPHRVIDGIVIGYDEINMWVLVHYKCVSLFTVLEYEICKWLRNSEDKRFRHFWCDGVELSERSIHYSKSSVSKNKYVNLRAWIGKIKDARRESLYDFKLNFGPKAISRFEKDLSIMECFSHVCVLDTDRKFIEIQLL